MLISGAVAKVLRIRSSCTWVRTRAPATGSDPSIPSTPRSGWACCSSWPDTSSRDRTTAKASAAFSRRDGRIGLPLLIFALAVHLPVGLRRRPPSPASRVALMGRNRFDELERRRSGRPSRRHCPVKLPALVERVTSNRQAEPPKRLTPSRRSESGDIDAWDVKAQEAAEGCAEYERPQEYRQYR